MQAPAIPMALFIKVGHLSFDHVWRFWLKVEIIGYRLNVEGALVLCVCNVLL
jgi:hypothetical protein